MGCTGAASFNGDSGIPRPRVRYRFCDYPRDPGSRPGQIRKRILFSTNRSFAASISEEANRLGAARWACVLLRGLPSPFLHGCITCRAWLGSKRLGSGTHWPGCLLAEVRIRRQHVVRSFSQECIATGARPRDCDAASPIVVANALCYVDQRHTVWIFRARLRQGLRLKSEAGQLWPDRILRNWCGHAGRMDRDPEPSWLK